MSKSDLMPYSTISQTNVRNTALSGPPNRHRGLLLGA